MKEKKVYERARPWGDNNARRRKTCPPFADDKISCFSRRSLGRPCRDVVDLPSPLDFVICARSRSVSWCLWFASVVQSEGGLCFLASPALGGRSSWRSRSSSILLPSTRGMVSIGLSLPSCRGNTVALVGAWRLGASIVRGWDDGGNLFHSSRCVIQQQECHKAPVLQLCVEYQEILSSHD